MGLVSISKTLKTHSSTLLNNRTMNKLNYFSRGWSAEQIRLRHTLVWKLVLLFPVFVSLLYFCIFYFKGQFLVKAEEQQAWEVFFDNTSRTVFTLFLPLFVILFALLNEQLNHQANIRKFLYTLPSPQWAQLSAQWLYLLMLYTITFIWFMVMLLASGWILSLLRPDLGFEQFVSKMIFLAIFNGYLASMGILALQFVLSYYFSNMIVPLSIGMGGFISALVLIRWEHIIYHPYAYQIFAYTNTLALKEGDNQVFIQSVLYGIGLSILVLLAGYLFRKRVTVEN